MKTFFKIALLSIVLTTSGCMTPEQLEARRTPERAAELTKSEYDPYKRETVFTGPSYYVGSHVVILRSVKTGFNEIRHQIYVQASFPEWAFLNSAFDLNGNQLPFVPVSKDVGSCSRYGCTVYEHIALPVSQAYLESNMHTGINIKLFGKSGSAEVKVPANYIIGYLRVAK